MGEHVERTCALFVDFDNMYIGLRDDSAKAAETFATEPGRWLRWLEDGLPGAEVTGADGWKRRVLVRRCYLNPIAFGRYRAYFTRSGFSVVDCPPLTAGGKNSADIVMVMDVLDVLGHKTRFDEFILLSGDADFTPVFLRLRAHDRRTTALVATPTAAAYRASSDLLIPEEVFVEQALGMAGEWPDVEPESCRTSILARMGARLEQAARSAGPLPAAGLVRYYLEFSEFRNDGNWLGTYSLRALTEAIVGAHPRISIVEGEPWSVVAGPTSPGALRRDCEPTPAPEGVLAFLRALVGRSQEPVLMSQAAEEVIREYGGDLVAGHWFGHGSFGAFLAASAHPGFDVAPVSPGCLWDPTRHRLPDGKVSGDRWRGASPALVDLVRRVHALTDAPRLTSSEYRALFAAVAAELGQRGYELSATSKAVRDRCVESGFAVSRGAVSFVLKGLCMAGCAFSADPAPAAPDDLAEHFQRNVRSMLEQARAELTPEEAAILTAWLAPGLPVEPRDE